MIAYLGGVYQVIDKKIIKLREERGWSQLELSKRMHKKNSGHVAMVEAGKRQNLSLMTACELARAFGMSLDELVSGTEYDWHSWREEG